MEANRDSPRRSKEVGVVVAYRGKGAGRERGSPVPGSPVEDFAGSPYDIGTRRAAGTLSPAAGEVNPIFATALEVQQVCRSREWRFCFIGAVAVQRWGEPRLTLDVD